MKGVPFRTRLVSRGARACVREYAGLKVLQRGPFAAKRTLEAINARGNPVHDFGRENSDST